MTDSAEIESQTLYVRPDNMITTLPGGNFAVRAAEQAPGERATIDSFLVTLAEHRAERSIGVILAGRTATERSAWRHSRTIAASRLPS